MDTRMILEMLAALILVPAFILASCVAIVITVISARDKRVGGSGLLSGPGEVQVDSRNHH
jgi:hypothetical protein